MHIWLFFVGVLLSITSVQAAERFNLPLESGEEVTVTVYPSTFGGSDQPLLIWFTEDYSSTVPFKRLVSQFNDLGYDFWQVDLLDSYFIERSANNIRGLTGEGVAEVLRHANEVATKQDRKFVAMSSGRMSLVLLRGSRLWQLNHEPKNGVGALQQLVTFFPNLYDAPQKAGDAPSLFPIVSATSLPITLVQPSEGTYKLKLLDIVEALNVSHSLVTVVPVLNARDWYFFRSEPTEIEKKAGDALPSTLTSWLKASQFSAQKTFTPVKNLAIKEATVAVKGLVPLTPRIAPNFELMDINGQVINLEDKRGKVILLNFWASWCPPCVKEIPSMNRLAESFDPEEFEIVSVNFKESPEFIAAFLNSVQVDFPVLIDLEGKVSNDYEIFSFPSSFMLDAEGTLRYSVNAAIEWDEPGVKKLVKSLMEP